jgi:hypothetical protein
MLTSAPVSALLAARVRATERAERAVVDREPGGECAMNSTDRL